MAVAAPPAATVTELAPSWLTARSIAHRGYHGDGVPENSLAAAQRAASAGFGIECDTQQSADGTAMVFHDWQLERLTGQAGYVADHTSDALEAMPLLGSDPDKSPQTPLRLGKFLAAIGGAVPVLIEIKSRPALDIEPACRSVAQALEGYDGQAGIMSFDPRVPRWFSQHRPKICRGLVGTDSLLNGFERVWRNPDMIDEAQPQFLALDRRDLDRPEAAVWRVSGKAVLSWTIRTAEEAARARPLADALIAEGEALNLLAGQSA